ncbi:MAG: serine hydrolase [Flavobacteriaceae bacterium]|nr:serine hydrolase [Flavobacteriaceae bacterium]
MKNIIGLSLLMFSFWGVNSQQLEPLVTKDYQKQQKWVDSIVSKMTVEQKIGQLIMLQAYSNKDKVYEDKLDYIIKKYHLGGLIFMQGTAKHQAELTNRFQESSTVPLLIGFDGEWGLDMRLKDTYKFPWNMTMGAIQDDSLIYDFGEVLGEHCKRMGIHINFAPVVDVNSNPKNPIIGNRSFGENKKNVTKKSIAFTKGIQSVGVMACAKHFPGHGDTSSDSHKTLPIIKHKKKRIYDIEMYPYSPLFDNGLASVMVAHLEVPSLEKKRGLPSSLSYEIVTEILQKEKGFKGLIITDALNMGGVSASKKPGDIELDAFIAGNDILLFPQDIEAAVSKIKKAITNRLIDETRLNFSVRKILMSKYWAGLNKYKPISLDNLYNDLHKRENDVLYRELAENAVTLLKNKEKILPIKDISKGSIAYLKLGEANSDEFLKYLNKYSLVKQVSADNIPNSTKTLIIGFHISDANPWKSFKFSEKELKLISQLSKKYKVILSVFASPYSLIDIKSFKNIETVLLCYQNSDVFQQISAQIIFGALDTKGELPVNIAKSFKIGEGLSSKLLKRLSYGDASSVGMDYLKLQKIDSVANMVIDSAMAPGLQILVVRKGKVVFEKSYGYHTYKKSKIVKNTDIYDLASLTKILGGLPLLMKATEDKIFSLNDNLGEKMSFLEGTNKECISFKEAFSHTGGFKSWIPFYKKTIDSPNKKVLAKYYRNTKDDIFSIKIAKDMYMRRDYVDSIYKIVSDSPLLEEKKYKYSGLVFFLMKKYLEDCYKKPMDKVNNDYIYDRIGAHSMMYNPIGNIDIERIVPSEIDDYYRYQELVGYVHDMGAAMMGGVNGNAGLFSNSNDIAKMMQMYLQNGYYGGRKYFKKRTISKFNRRYFSIDSVRRGLVFDKLQIKKIEEATCGCVSDNSFGHSGFTGTYTWADPDTELVYVFLSNRIYPTMTNNKLSKMNIRTDIQKIIQEAIID